MLRRRAPVDLVLQLRRGHVALHALVAQRHLCRQRLSLSPFRPLARLLILLLKTRMHGGAADGLVCSTLLTLLQASLCR